MLEYQEMISSEAIEHPNSYRLSSVFQASYALAGGAIEIVVDVRNGKIPRITAFAGYEGFAPGSVRVGMLVADVMSNSPGWYYDEGEELILNRSEPGIALNVSESDPDPSAVMQLYVTAVSVYSDALETAARHIGQW